MSTLRRLSSAQPVRAIAPSEAAKSPTPVAKLEKVHAGVGLTAGTLTFKGHTYRFNSGQANAAALPVGTYVLRKGKLPANPSEFTSNGVAFVYFLDGKTKNGTPVAPRTGGMWDGRLGRMRTELRMRPDIGEPGTAGAMGMVGTKEELQRLTKDLDEALARNGGKLVLTVG